MSSRLKFLMCVCAFCRGRDGEGESLKDEKAADQIRIFKSNCCSHTAWTLEPSFAFPCVSYTSVGSVFSSVNWGYKELL